MLDDLAERRVDEMKQGKPAGDTGGLPAQRQHRDLVAGYLFQQADADELGCARHVAERADPDQAGQPVSVGAVGYGGQPPWVRFASRSRAASKPRPSMSSSRANMPQAYGGYAEAAPCQKVTGACRRSRSSPRRTHLANG